MQSFMLCSLPIHFFYQDPVSFSIKNKEETASNALQNTVLPQDASDEEDKPTANNNSSNTATTTSASTATQNNRHVPEHVQKAIELVESQLMARNAQIAAALALRQQAAVLPVTNVLPLANIPASLSVPAVAVVATTPMGTSSSASATAPTKAEAERNAIFEQQQQQRHKELKKGKI